MTDPANRTVTLAIGGRNHTIAVAPSEEAHVLALARMIDDRVRQNGLIHGQTETRMLLIVALMLADELHAAQNAPPPPVQSGPDIAVRVAALADRVEKLAMRLEHSDTTP